MAQDHGDPLVSFTGTVAKGSEGAGSTSAKVHRGNSVDVLADTSAAELAPIRDGARVVPVGLPRVAARND
jgi:hypothetical protein